MTAFFRVSSLALVVGLLSTPAAFAAESYEPSVGQPGKDVVWVPTSQTMVDKMLDMAKVTPKDFVIDLGSGDGRTVITAAKRGAKAHGIEYNPDMVELAQKRATEAGVADKATFEKADLFESDFSKAQVITMFLLPSINERLRPKILDLKPGTRIVSNSFRMGDWQPDESEHVTNECQNYCNALLWIVPAKVDGTWRLGNQDLVLKQSFQMLEGTLGTTPISNAKLNGADITFTAGPKTYKGTVNGTSMKGSDWSAAKK